MVDVASMARDIERMTARDGWQHDIKTVPDAIHVLKKLATLRVDVELLKSTGIGKMVKKLTKHQDEVVKGYSSSLTNKWKSQVGVTKNENNQNSRPINEKVTTTRPQDDVNRFDLARKRLQNGYANEKAKREARTVQVLNRPISKKRGTTISASSSKSTVMRNKLMMQRRAVTTPMRSGPNSSLTPPSKRPVPPPTMQRRPATAPSSRDVDEVRRRRQERLRALANQGNVSDNSSNKLPASRPPTKVNARKRMLDQLYPRVSGTPVEQSHGKRSTPTNGNTTTKKKNVTYNEGQREVLQWLKSLDVDMKDYAPTFFNNGFDSIKLLNQIQSSDLSKMIPKVGHQRMIEKALQDLKRKHTTRAISREKRSKPRQNPYSDEDSDDSFVVNDDEDFYAPGMISAMIQKGRRRKRRYSIDSTDSSNMEASFDQIQHEEERSKRYGDYEDYQEELKNEKRSKK